MVGVLAKQSAKSAKKVLVCKKVVFHKSFISKANGLMWHRKINDEAHIFLFDEKKKVPLTMWFVFFPIDVLYLDENKKIIEIKENFRPFTNYYPKKECSFVVELPQGTIRSKDLRIKDLVHF